jgi:hypothetical protein
MDLLLLGLTIGLPLIKIILFPARAVGRGGSWTIIGAVMIVGVMMALWFGVQSMTGTGSNGTTATASSTQTDAQQQADDKLVADALAKYL